MDQEPTSLISFLSLTDAGFATTFWNLYKREDLTDITLDVHAQDGSKTFLVHKFVLSLRCPYFADMFYRKKENMESIINIIPLRVVNLKAFTAMIEYFYDYSPELETPKQAYDLYKLASTFNVPTLMNFCSKFLCGFEISPSNVFRIYEVSEYMRNNSLKDRCLKLIQDRTREVLQAYPLHEFTPSMIHIILALPELYLKSEYELLEWIFSWAKELCEQKNSEYSSAREALQKLLPDLHFFSLEDADFAMFYKDHSDFFTQDEVISIFMNIALPGSWPKPDWYDKDAPSRSYFEPQI